MRTQAFDELLNELCAGILSKRDRVAVRNELADHLEEKYNELLRSGLSKEEAEERAIGSLGDRAALRRQLALVHPYAPRLSMKRAMHLLILGTLLSSVYIELFHGIHQLFSFAGGLLIVTALYCLSRAGSLLNRAFLCRVYGFAVGAAVYAVAPLFADVPHFAFLSILPQLVLHAVSWVFLMRGMRSLTAPYADASDKPLRFTPVTVLWFAANAVLPSIMRFYTEGDVSGQTYSVDGPFAYVVFGLVIVYLIYVLQLFLRVDRLLYKSDHDYDIVDAPKRKTAVCLAALFGCLIAVFAGNIVFLKQPPAPETDASQAVLSETDRTVIRKALVSYSVPEEVAQLLPDDELLRYASVPALPEGAYAGDFSGGGENNVRIEEYALPCVDGNGAACFRFLRYIRIAADKPLRAAYFSEPVGMMTPPLCGSEFLRIRRTQNGRQYMDQPLRTYRDTLGSLTGFEFQQGDAVEIIFAVTYAAADVKMNVQFDHSFLLYHTPLLGFSRLPEDFLAADHPPLLQNRVHVVTSETIF